MHPPRTPGTQHMAYVAKVTHYRSLRTDPTFTTELEELFSRIKAIDPPEAVLDWQAITLIDPSVAQRWAEYPDHLEVERSRKGLDIKELVMEFSERWRLGAEGPSDLIASYQRGYRSMRAGPRRLDTLEELAWRLGELGVPDTFWSDLCLAFEGADNEALLRVTSALTSSEQELRAEQRCKEEECRRELEGQEEQGQQDNDGQPPVMPRPLSWEPLGDDAQAALMELGEQLTALNDTEAIYGNREALIAAIAAGLNDAISLMYELRPVTYGRYSQRVAFHDSDGKVLHVVPADLPTKLFWWWFRLTTINGAEAFLFGRSDAHDHGRRDERNVALSSHDLLPPRTDKDKDIPEDERVWARHGPAGIGDYEWLPEKSALREEYLAEVRRWLAAFLEAVSPGAREIWAVLEEQLAAGEELNIAEAARKLGKNANTAYVQIHSSKRKKDKLPPRP